MVIHHSAQSQTKSTTVLIVCFFFQIFSNSFEDDAGSDDLVAPRSTCKSWGVGSGEYKLTDESGAVSLANKFI